MSNLFTLIAINIIIQLLYFRNDESQYHSLYDSVIDDSFRKKILNNCNYAGGNTISDNCDEVCDTSSTCLLSVGGPESYIWVVMVMYLCTIVFYDLQKVR